LLVALVMLLSAGSAFAAQIVQTEDIADGAVVDAKISGPISSAKLDGSTLDVDSVDGMHASDFATASHGHEMVEVTGLQATLDAKAENSALATKADLEHGHNLTEVAGLVTELDGKADSLHGHGMLDVAGLQSALDAKADSAHGHDADDILTGVLPVDKLHTYAGVKVVHKGPADGQDSFNTISGALNQITDSSANNRYVVVVMPGVYDDEIVSAYNKQYIDVVGLDKNSVTIRGTGVGSRVVTLSQNSSLSNVTVVGDSLVLVDVSATGAAVENCNLQVSRSGGIGLYIQGVSRQKIQNVSVTTNIPGGAYGSNGLEIRASAASDMASIVIDNLQINGKFGYGVLIFATNDPDDPIKITNAKIATEGSIGLFMVYGHLALENVELESTYNNGARGLKVQSATNFRSSVKCRRCQFDAMYAVDIDADSEFMNSIFEGNVSSYANGGDGVLGSIKIGNSQIRGELTNYQGYSPMGIKLVNCFDANFDKIVDGDY